MGILKKNILEVIKRTSLSFRGIAILILSALYIVHGILAIAFAFAGIVPLIISNIIAIILYTCTFFTCACKERYSCFVIFSFIIIELHSVYAYVMLGWDYGFSLYCVLMMPIALFMLYLYEKEKMNLKSALILNFITLLCVLASRVSVYINGPQITLNRDWAVAISTFNMFISGTSTLVFCGVFIYQRLYMDSKIRKQTEKLDFMANYDSLTMLRNRRNLRGILLKEYYKRKEKMIHEPMCIALGDIDNFKKINDIYGHDCGDMVLVKLGSIFINRMKNKGYVARWGGEEMLFFLPMNLQEAKKIMNDILEEINDFVFTYNNRDFSVSMTFGITEYQEGKTLDEMLIKADMLMYQGKEAGRNRIIVE